MPSGEEMDRLLEETSELGEDDMRGVWEEHEEWERSLQAGISGGGGGCGHETAGNGVGSGGKETKNGGGDGERNGKDGVKNGGTAANGESRNGRGDNADGKEKEKPMSISGEIAEMTRRGKQLQLEKEQQEKKAKQDKEKQEKEEEDVEMTSA